jgi:hypothetical protein
MGFIRSLRRGLRGIFLDLLNFIDEPGPSNLGPGFFAFAYGVG